MAITLQEFVLAYLKEIQATVVEHEGVYTVDFPPGRKRRFGRRRRFVFDASKLEAQVELLEPGSPLLKLLVLDAKAWGGLGACHSAALAPGTLLYTFQFTTFSSLKKRAKFVTVVLSPGATSPSLSDGVPGDLSDAHVDLPSMGEAQRLRDTLNAILPMVESAGRDFAKEAVAESAEAFNKYMGRVSEYFQGLRQESASEEARIRKRLGEIQSKLYFAEDGLRQLKLERERDRLTQELYHLKQKRTQSDDKLSTDETEHQERQRRRHEPKLQVRLVAATLIRPVSEAPPPPPPDLTEEPPAEEALMAAEVAAGSPRAQVEEPMTRDPATPPSP